MGIFRRKKDEGTLSPARRFRARQGVSQDLRGADPAGADLSWADLNGRTLEGADLAGAILSMTWLERADLTGANLDGADMAIAFLVGVKSSGIIGTPLGLPYKMHLVGGYLVGPLANLRQAELGRADLTGMDLSQAVLKGADLRGAVLRGAVLRRANLVGANLAGADLSDADLVGADMSEADLTDTILVDATMGVTGLDGTDLAGRALHRTNLRAADLSGTDLQGADLRGVDLTTADLSDADLTGTLLTGANLTRAVLVDALTDGAVTDGTTACPGGKPGPCWPGGGPASGRREQEEGCTLTERSPPPHAPCGLSGDSRSAGRSVGHHRGTGRPDRAPAGCPTLRRTRLLAHSVLAVRLPALRAVDRGRHGRGQHVGTRCTLSAGEHRGLVRQPGVSDVGAARHTTPVGAVVQPGQRPFHLVQQRVDVLDGGLGSDGGLRACRRFRPEGGGHTPRSSGSLGRDAVVSRLDVHLHLHRCSVSATPREHRRVRRWPRPPANLSGAV